MTPVAAQPVVAKSSPAATPRPAEASPCASAAGSYDAGGCAARGQVIASSDSSARRGISFCIAAGSYDAGGCAANGQVIASSDSSTRRNLSFCIAAAADSHWISDSSCARGYNGFSCAGIHIIV